MKKSVLVLIAMMVFGSASIAQTSNAPTDVMFSLTVKSVDDEVNYQEQVQKTIRHSKSCVAQTKILNAYPGGTPGRFSWTYHVELRATCTSASIHLYEILRSNPNFELSLMLPVPSMSGSNR